MAVRKIKNSWYVDITQNYIRYRKKSPDNSKVGARDYESFLRQKLARGESINAPQLDKNEIDRKQKFKDFVLKWFEIYVKNNNKHSEIFRKKYVLQRHLIPFFGKTQMDKITSMQVESYKASKLATGLSNKTINNHLNVLSSCLHTAQDWLELKTIPKIKLLRLPPPKTVFLSQEECDRLLTNTSGVCREVIFTALKTGLRLGELIALDWSDINWNDKTLTVRHSWCDRKKGIVTPKSNRERHIPLTDELYKKLLQKRQATGLIFVDGRNKRLDGKAINREIINACKKTGIKEVTCHTLRHTFASHLVMAGAPLKAIQELLGHSEIQTTMRYAHLSSSSLREAVYLLEPVQKEISRNFRHYMGNRLKKVDKFSAHPKHIIAQKPLIKAIK
ncbi:MAG: tyrosine-type recombinase/integrase [Candidatus Dadabacteria bacterium]|nr:tyrosine-type recombinase/integrase [Candidatus Dadabacteria bacterium]